jgi:ribonuclease HI
MIKRVEEYLSEPDGLSFLDAHCGVPTGNNVNQVVTILERCAAKSIEWAIRRGIQFDTAKTEAALFTRRRGHKRHLGPKLTTKTKAREGFIWLNRQVTRWLSVWLDVQMTIQEHPNRCMRRARGAEARLQTLTKTDGVVPESVRGVQVAGIQAVPLYGSELWWDPSEAGMRDDLHLILNRQARSILGTLPTTPWGALMPDSELTHTPVVLESRQQRFAARLANPCSNKLRKLHQDPSSGTLVCRAGNKEHEHGRTTEDMNWPAPGEESVVRTVILNDATAAMRAAQRWAIEKEAKVGVGVWMWWTDGSRSDDGRVGAVAVCKHRDEWRSHCSYLGTGRMQVFEAELWAIGLALDVAIKKRETLQKHGVKTVAGFSDSQAAIRRTAHVELDPGQRLARRINTRAQSLRAHGIATEIHWVSGHSGIPRNQEADRQVNLARDTSGSTVIERPYTSASNSARRISEGRSAAKVQWEADKCNKHFCYRLKGKAGTKRPILMTRVKSLAARFYRL